MAYRPSAASDQARIFTPSGEGVAPPAGRGTVDRLKRLGVQRWCVARGMHPPLRNTDRPIQLRSGILMDVLGQNGIDRARPGEKVRQLQTTRNRLLERLRRRGYLPGQPGNQKALQS